MYFKKLQYQFFDQVKREKGDEYANDMGGNTTAESFYAQEQENDCQYYEQHKDHHDVLMGECLDEKCPVEADYCIFHRMNLKIGKIVPPEILSVQVVLYARERKKWFGTVEYYFMDRCIGPFIFD